jgi:hypothetical protein
VDALQATLRSVLTDTALRQQLQQGARAAAARLPTWEQAAHAVHEVINKVSEPA